MENDIYVYRVPLGAVKAAVTPNTDDPGYTVYINEKLDHRQALEAYRHEVEHIMHGALEEDLPADQIEVRDHERRQK